MYKETLKLLRCPYCGGDIIIQRINELMNNEIISGNAICSNCVSSFRIENGILDFITLDSSLKDEINHWDTIAESSYKVPADYEVTKRLRPSIQSVILDALKNCGEIENAVILEICCGEGTAISYLPDLVKKAHYIGVDISMGMLLRARKRKRTGWKIDFIRADANKQIIQENVVKLCFSFAALHHLDPYSAIRSISLQLIKSGYFMIFEPNKYNFFRIIGHNLIKNFYTKKDKPLSPFTIRNIARSFKLLLIKEQGLYPVGLPFSFLITFLKKSNFLLANKLKRITLMILFIDKFLSKIRIINLFLSSSIFQYFTK